MPTLHWMGMEQVKRHHRDVPLRALIREYVYPEKSPDEGDVTANRIIKGDNLEALKALLPEYEGRVNCVYIDPPYNTGNEGWVYNDNVSDPRLQKWLHAVVGKEGEDLCRHDKWLCMMYPRLRLLHQLLADDGSIWISIDDGEFAHLRLLLDEMFGAANFVADILWQKKYAVANDHKSIAPMHDHILVYRKSEAWKRNLLPRTEENDRQYRYSDDKGTFRPDNYTCNKSAEERPNLYYPILHPATGSEVWPSRNAVWRYTRETHEENVREGLVYWGKDGKGRVPAFKRYKHMLRNGGLQVPSTWWNHEFAGHTDEAKKEIRAILADELGKGDFITPKPVRLIERVLQIACKPDAIVLDAFAGSGTTGHAVLKMNADDGGSRRFILIEMEEYAESITARRLKKVIDASDSGVSASFSFETLGEPYFIEDDELNPALGLDQIRRYVAAAEGVRSAQITEGGQGGSPFVLGTTADTAVFLCHDSRRPVVLDRKLLTTLNISTSTAVIYAHACLLDEATLRERGIIFRKIPRDIRRY
ncbi:site-specific DNA-methyltransferase [Candidatus Ozemobacteraceae bacterium]|nr:site-specific DNA-methyltransferase [Candidatus Ozemobacteraceae bacterium]